LQLCWQALLEGLAWGSPVHVAALVRALGVVGDEPFVEHGLHFIDGLKSCPAALDAEVFVQRGAVEAFDNAVGLRPLDPCGAVVDLFKLQEQLVRMLVGPATELAAIVRENDLDLCFMRLECWQHIMVENVHGGDRQLGRIEPRPSIA
jgi:hypothetical protein